jgi:hypothetical protein
MQAIINVKGNRWCIMPPLTGIGRQLCQWTGPEEIVADVSNQAELDALLRRLQPRLLFHCGAPIQLHSSLPGYAVIVLRDPRYFFGPEPFTHRDKDIATIRDIIIEHEICADNAVLLIKLRENLILLYAIEQFIKATLNTHGALADLYKCLELIRSATSSEHSNTVLGSKANTSYITSRANINTNDQRHSPKNPATIATVPEEEVHECFNRMRQIILNFASNL